jgi:hypothetical protein
MQVGSKEKVEYGDFQTPLELAEKVCHKLLYLNVNPDIIVEPTCGIGNFIQASAYSFQLVSKIIGIEINKTYLDNIYKNQEITKDKRIQVQEGDFFELDLSSLIKTNNSNKKILLLGNFPWVTNSQQGIIGARNLPQKTNFQNHKGLDAITGKSNFDISEWMLIKSIQWLQRHEAYLAMLCKTSVARKLLNYIYSNKLNLAYSATYTIDAKKYFGANVDACLLFCKFDSDSKNYFCDVFNSLDADTCYRTGYRNNILVRDTSSFDNLKDLYNPKIGAKWRSGVKHDCSNVMEFRKVDDAFINGLGEVIDIEENYLFP